MRHQWLRRRRNRVSIGERCVENQREGLPKMAEAFTVRQETGSTWVSRHAVKQSLQRFADPPWPGQKF